MNNGLGVPEYYKSDLASLVGDKIPQMQLVLVKKGSNLQNQQYYVKYATLRSENHSECSINWLQLSNMSHGVQEYPRSHLASSWMTQYPRYKDFDFKGGQIYKINNLLEIMQHPGPVLLENSKKQ